MSASEAGSQNQASRQSSTRRQRAPTITIDTSAVCPPGVDSDEPPMQSLSPPGAQGETHQQHNKEHEQGSISLNTERGTELRTTNSFDSRDSRPTSPHNVSSPTSKWGGQPHNFLSVPTARSRGNSVDSEDVAHSPATSYGGETYIPSPASSQNGEARQIETAHSSDQLIPDDEALKPDPGTEADFEVQDNRFAFSPGQLNKMLNPKSLGAFHALGGLSGLEKGLRTDRLSGLSVDEKRLEGVVTFDEVVGKQNLDGTKLEAGANRPLHRRGTSGIANKGRDDSFADRKRIFSDNQLPEKKTKSIFELAWLAYNDKVLILLTVAAVVSLALGIYQSIQAGKPGHDPSEKVAWVEGVAIVVAIVVVVVVGALNDWQKERQFVKLNKKKEDRMVKVIRSGKSQEISVHHILVGDVVHIEAGDMIPVDGIFISGHNVTCDESSATGESDLLKKSPAETVYKAITDHESLHKLDPFLISGGKITEGVGTFLVTATGVNSSHGRTMLSLQEDPQTTPLQSKLNVLAEYIAKLGLGAGLILFVVTFIRFLIHRQQAGLNADQSGQAFLQVFIVAVTIIVVAVPEGLPLAVTLALAFATTRMLKDNNLVRQLRACETMGNATTICSDKTGTLTQNKMSVVAGTFGSRSKFNQGKSGEDQDTNGSLSMPKEVAKPYDSREVSSGQMIKTFAEETKDLMKQAIVSNSTAFEGEVDGEETFVGSKTETALLLFARAHLGLMSLSEERSGAEVVQLVPFDSKRKCMATVIKIANDRYRLHVKGASEIMLATCSKIVSDPTTDITEVPMTEDIADSLSQTIEAYASRSLRTIGLLYKDFEQWPPKGFPVQHDDPKAADFDKVFQNMTFLGVVGIKDPLRDGVTDAVRECQKAGVFVRMVTGDNITTAKAIAEDCGIFTAGGLVMEGPQFRKMSRTQMNQTIPRLQVLARSSPDDKRILVKRLREMGETVAVTGKIAHRYSRISLLTTRQVMEPTMRLPLKVQMWASRWESLAQKLPRKLLPLFSWMTTSLP